MIHFRLRRSFRLAVSLLSLNFAGSSNAFYSARTLFRGTHATASLVLHASALRAMRLLPLPYSFLSNIRSSKQRSSLRPRRYLASIGLLLALSLEVCGCNPADDIGLSLYTPAANETQRDPAPNDRALSFYDPAESAGATALSLVTLNDPPTDQPTRAIEVKPLPWAIPESVYLVYKEHRPDATQPHQSPVATAFVLSVPDRTHHRYLRLLVTARHVVDPQWAHCSQQNPTSIDLRLNRRNGGVGYETIALQAGTVRRFYTSSDSAADLAVIPLDQSLIPNLEDYKFIDVPFRLLPTDSEMRLIRTDQQIMTAGLPNRPSVESGNYPVFDSGFLTKMPAEPVAVGCGTALAPQPQVKQLHVWFINAEIPQGVSGAPVYTSIARGPGSAKTPVLLGVQSVAWPDKGVAGITPSPALGDLIQSALHESSLNLDFYRGPNP